MLASVPNTMTPALSIAFFSRAIRFTRFFAASCCSEGTLSERSRTKKMFMPSMGSSHCSPAMASTRMRQMLVRNVSATHLRQGPNCASVRQPSQNTHASAGSTASNQRGWVNWKFIGMRDA